MGWGVGRIKVFAKKNTCFRGSNRLADPLMDLGIYAPKGKLYRLFGG